MRNCNGKSQIFELVIGYGDQQIENMREKRMLTNAFQFVYVCDIHWYVAKYAECIHSGTT